MKSRTGRMAKVVTRLGVTATMALVVAMLGAILPRVRGRLVSGRSTGTRGCQGQDDPAGRAAQAGPGEGRAAPQ